MLEILIGNNVKGCFNNLKIASDVKAFSVSKMFSLSPKIKTVNETNATLKQNSYIFLVEPNKSKSC